MRVKIVFTKAFCFETDLAVRIDDINYGGHLGNDRILAIMQEARLQFLSKYHFTELDCGGCGLIMADSAIQYKGEAFYGDQLKIELSVENITSSAFDFYYKLTTVRQLRSLDIAYAKTAMICFDYVQRKIVSMPLGLNNILHQTN